MAKQKKNRIDDLAPAAAADPAPPSTTPAVTPPAMTYVEVHRCPRCDSIADPGAVTNTPWMDSRYNWRRTVMLICSHCNKGTVVELVYNGAGAWRNEGAPREVSAAEAAQIATDIARREATRTKEAAAHE